CCKSPKLPGDNFPAASRSDRRPPICVPSIVLRRSLVSFSSGDEVPHILTRKSRLQPGEFLATCAKRLLQQNRPAADVSGCSKGDRPALQQKAFVFDHLIDLRAARGRTERWRRAQSLIPGRQEPRPTAMAQLQSPGRRSLSRGRCIPTRTLVSKLLRLYSNFRSSAA